MLRWWDRWKAYASSTAGLSGDCVTSSLAHPSAAHEPPGALDNQPLLQPGQDDELIEGLREGLDFTIVCLPVWQLLLSKWVFRLLFLLNLPKLSCLASGAT